MPNKPGSLAEKINWGGKKPKKKTKSESFEETLAKIVEERKAKEAAERKTENETYSEGGIKRDYDSKMSALKHLAKPKKQVTVIAKDEKGLKAGLEKAEEVLEDDKMKKIKDLLKKRYKNGGK